MKLLSAFLLCLAFSVLGVQAQNLPLRTVTTLPAQIDETSGLIMTGPNTLWSHNDSGGDPKLYAFDTTGTLLRTLVIKGVSNIDWEELTQDAAGNVYVGDFGNNSNNRTNLMIYKIPNPDNVVGDSVVPEIIRFSYPDQVSFPPTDSLRYFDMEGMVAVGDSLYLFSKNRTDPFDGLTKSYSLPQDSGTYVATLLDSVVTCSSSMVNCWVSAAGISPSAENLVLLAYGKLWIYSCFEGTDFFGGGILERQIAFSQTEAVVWKDATHIYITDELLNGIFGRNLYEADLGPYIALPNANLGADTTVFVGDSISIGVPAQFGASYSWNTGETSESITVNGASGGGTFILQVTAINGCQATDTIVVSSSVGLATSADAIDLRLFPNPFSQATNFHLRASPGTQFQWRLINAAGKVMERGLGQMNNIGEFKKEIGKDCPAGFYFLEIESQNWRKTKKLLKG